MEIARPQRMIQLLRQIPDATGVRNDLIGTLQIDASAVGPAADWIEEQGVTVESIEVGKRYLFKTVTHYYAGRVRSKTLTDVVLTDRPEIVFRTGSWPECAMTGNWERSQDLPDGWIVSLAAVVSAGPCVRRK